MGQRENDRVEPKQKEVGRARKSSGGGEGSQQSHQGQREANSAVLLGLCSSLGLSSPAQLVIPEGSGPQVTLTTSGACSAPPPWAPGLPPCRVQPHPGHFWTGPVRPAPPLSSGRGQTHHQTALFLAEEQLRWIALTACVGSGHSSAPRPLSPFWGMSLEPGRSLDRRLAAC